MRYLLDSCTLLWIAEGSRKLSDDVVKIVLDPTNDGAVGIISLWEVSMKSVAGKLPSIHSPTALADRSEQNGISVIPLELAHVERFHNIPPVHRDPFDRLIAAVALEEGRTVLTPDIQFDQLGVLRTW